MAQPVAISQTDTSSTPSEGRGVRIAGIAVGAVGVAGVVAGIILGVHANSLNDEATKSGSHFDSSKYESAKTYQDLEWVSFGVGAAGIITGGVLYYLRIKQQSASSVAIRPIFAPGAGDAALYATL